MRVGQFQIHEKKASCKHGNYDTNHYKKVKTTSLVIKKPDGLNGYYFKEIGDDS